MDLGVDTDVLFRLLALLVLLLIGTGLRVSGPLTERRTATLNAVAYYIALPALVFVATYDQAIGELISLTLVAGLLAVVGTTAVLAWIIHWRRSTSERRSVAVVQSYHSNLGYLGIPLVAATFSAEVTAIASVVLGIVTLVQVPLTIVILSVTNGAETDLLGELRGLVTNPVLVALVAGLGVGATEVTVPGTLGSGLDVLGSLALPLALLCVGASLRIDAPSLDLGATGSVVAMKIVVMPLVAWVVFSLVTVDTATFTAAIVMLGMPTAVSTYVFAAELGGDAEFASLNVFATTLVSVLTLLVLITVVS